MGLLRCLYQFDTQVASQRKGWPSNALNNLAEAMVFEWKNGGPSKEDMAAVIDFIEENLGEWGSGWCVSCHSCEGGNPELKALDSAL
jgi:hypothetical protein